MPFVAMPNIVQAEIRATRFGQQIENRIFVNVLETVTPTLTLAVATSVWNWVENWYAGIQPDSVAFTECFATDMQHENGSQATVNTDPSSGAGTGPELPNEVSLCMSLRTGNRGRSARGRFYLMGLCTAFMADENNVSTTYAADALEALDNLRTGLSDDGFQWTIVSQISGGAPRVGGPVYFPVTTITLVDRQVDSMKSRKPGVGS